jgi:transcriptional regulator with XRE-family HTH domain
MADRKHPPFVAKTLNPAQSPRAMYGAELRFQRIRAGLTQSALGELLFVGTSHITRLESGERRIHPDMAKELDRILDAGGFFVRNLAAGRATPYPEHFAGVVELEGDATAIRQWEPLLIPGLLQTEAYALAVIRAYDPVLDDELVRERLAARLVRARIFDGSDRPLCWAIVHEAVVRCPVGGAATMAEQLRHVATMVRRNRIVFQVLPYSVGAHAGMEGPLRLMNFENDTPMSYLSSIGNGTLVDDPAAVRRHELAYDLLGAAALSPEASLTLIEAVAEEYEHGSQPDGGDVA